MGYKMMKYGEEINTTPSNANAINYTDTETVKDAIDDLNDTITYKTTESVVGTYLGKPLYRRCCNGSLSSGSDVVLSGIGTSNIKLRNCGGFLVEASGVGMLSLNGDLGSDWNCGLYLNDTSVLLFYGFRLNNGTYEIWFEYTKNTD